MLDARWMNVVTRLHPKLTVIDWTTSFHDLELRNSPGIVILFPIINGIRDL